MRKNGKKPHGKSLVFDRRERIVNRVLGIDPGPKESAYVLLNENPLQVVDKGKVSNFDMLAVISKKKPYHLAVEMIASYGMPVGKEIFDTCLWIGRFWEAAMREECVSGVTFVPRKAEKMYLCGTMKANDRNIIAALVEKYAPYTPNRGKGTKKDPGFFYGFSGDVWQAMAVAVTDIAMREGETA